MDFTRSIQEMFEVYFSAEKQATCDNKRWFKND